MKQTKEVKMELHRKHWNEQQKLLQDSLKHESDASRAIELFLSQHAMVHSASVSGSGLWSFDDEIWQAISEDEARQIPPNKDHSIAWLYWHIARIEDVTMNLLIAGSPQLFHGDGWYERLGDIPKDTGNAMEERSIQTLSQAIDIAGLRQYRQAIGRRTRTIVQQLRPEELKQKVDPARLAQVSAQGAVVPAAQEIIDYWGGRTIAGLLLMPPTRHNFIHLNEASRLADWIRRH